jgi:hypothetical protein
MSNVMGTDFNPIALIGVLHRYSREDYGSIFLYLPRPRRAIDREAWAWLLMLRSMGAARKRWLVTTDHAEATLRKSHAHLFDPPPVCFETYRLHQPSLDRIFARL